MKECRAPFPPLLLQSKHFTCPLASSPGMGPGPAQPLHCRRLGTAQQVTSRHRFGLIRLVLIQLQKFGKHFVNNPSPGRVMLSQSGASQRVTFPALSRSP